METSIQKKKDVFSITVFFNRKSSKRGVAGKNTSLNEVLTKAFILETSPRFQRSGLNKKKK